VPRRKAIRNKKEEITTKGPYNKRDNVILKVAMYLNSKGDDGATIYNIISAKTTIGLNSQDQTRFTKNIMIPMEREGWVTMRVHSERNKVYVISEKGKYAINELLELRKNDSLLSKLESFRDLVR